MKFSKFFYCIAKVIYIADFRNFKSEPVYSRQYIFHSLNFIIAYSRGGFCKFCQSGCKISDLPHIALNAYRKIKFRKVFEIVRDRLCDLSFYRRKRILDFILVNSKFRAELNRCRILVQSVLKLLHNSADVSILCFSCHADFDFVRTAGFQFVKLIGNAF